MNKINKYLSLAFVATLGAGLATSCDNSKDNDYVSEYEGAPGIYFSNTENSYLELSDQASTISYPAYRDVAGGQVTVALDVEPLDTYANNDIYTFPASVTFPEGSKVGEVVIGYDISKAPMGEEQQYLLTLDAEPNPFSSNSIVITLVNPAPWELLGRGEYYDFGWGISDTSTGPANVNIYQQGVNRNIYRISNPYYALNEEDTYFQIQVLQPGDTYLGVTVTQPGIVAYDMEYIEYDPDEGSDVYIAFPGLFNGFDVEAAWTTNIVAEYQENGLPGLIYLAPIYFWPTTGSGFNTDLEQYIMIRFPGYISYDATLEVEYEGTLKGEDQSEYVLLSVELGEDITEARAAVSPTLSGDALITAIENGSVEYTSFSNSGNVKIPFENMETGNYNVAVVAYVEDTVKNSDSFSFFYVASDSDYNPNEGWTSLGYVNYTDGYVVSGLFTGTNKITYRVEIQQNNDYQGIYRLVNPYGTYFASFFGGEASSKDVPASYINIDATNRSRVKILQSETNLQFFGGDFNLMYCWSWADMWEKQGESIADIEAEGVYGTYADGEFTFPAMALSALWSDEPDSWYSANYALDYDAYEAGEEVPIYLNPDGTPFAPFNIDMNTLSDEGPATQAQTRSISMAATYFNLMQITHSMKQQPAHFPKPGKQKQSPKDKAAREKFRRVK